MKRMICALSALILLGCGTSAGTVNTTATPESTLEPTSEPSPEPSASAETPEPTFVMETDFSPLDYSDRALWLLYEEGNNDAQADAFLLPGAIAEGEVGNTVINELSFRRQQGLSNRMKGMVLDDCTIYAPARRQATLDAILGEDWQTYCDNEYADAAAAFEYYLENIHEAGRPLMLFGYSSGGMCLQRLLADYFAPDTPEANALRDDLAAAYLIGWGVPASFYEEYSALKPAWEDDDIGVIISFDAEFPEVTETPVLRADETYVSINPINWKSGNTPADKSENKGAVLVNAKGEIKSEIPALCGAFLDDTPRHALKITDIDPSEFPTTLTGFPEGALHEYDITLFYRNIEDNVEDRVEAWLSVHGKAKQDD
ncbi:MAG: DUF3089 domain-containing protein [Solobacterium sp.]|nr:DUF3089 domain-containing protein [Solobacterium sp.]